MGSTVEGDEETKPAVGGGQRQDFANVVCDVGTRGPPCRRPACSTTSPATSPLTGQAAFTTPKGMLNSNTVHILCIP
jgi:hypothetical protein